MNRNGLTCTSCQSPLGDVVYRGFFGDKHRSAKSLCETCAAAALEHERARRDLEWAHSRAWFKPEHVCATCGRKIIFTDTHIFGLTSISEQHFCSRDCRKANTALKRKAVRSAIACSVCGQTFTPKRSDAKTCSNACRQKAYRQSGYFIKRTVLE